MCSTTLDFTVQIYALRPNLIEINLICLSVCYIPTTSWYLDPLQKLDGVRVVHRFSFLCCCCFFVFCFVFVLCVVCPVFPVSLDCPFLIAASVFSSVHLPFWGISHYNISMQMSVFFSVYPLLFSLILFKNLQFECIPYPILTWIQKCMWTTIHK